MACNPATGAVVKPSAVRSVKAFDVRRFAWSAFSQRRRAVSETLPRVKASLSDDAAGASAAGSVAARASDEQRRKNLVLGMGESGGGHGGAVEILAKKPAGEGRGREFRGEQTGGDE